MDKIKFTEFYKEGIEKVMMFRDFRLGDNYDALASELNIHDINYLEATKQLYEHTTLKRIYREGIVSLITPNIDLRT